MGKPTMSSASITAYVFPEDQHNELVAQVCLIDWATYEAGVKGFDPGSLRRIDS